MEVRQPSGFGLTDGRYYGIFQFFVLTESFRKNIYILRFTKQSQNQIFFYSVTSPTELLLCKVAFQLLFHTG